MCHLLTAKFFHGSIDELRDSILFKILFSLALLMLPAGAQFAPTALAVPSTLTVTGTTIDPVEGTSSGTTVIQIAATTLATSADTVGNYTYTKTTSDTSRIVYSATTTQPNYTETENGTLLLTFTSALGGTYTNSGSYNGNDDGDLFNGTFTSSGTFTYSASITAPTISNVANQSTDEDTPTGAIAFTVNASTDPNLLTVSSSSSNTTLVPLGNVVLGGSGSNRTVSITPAANQNGTTTITLTVSNGALSASDTFVLTVNAINDSPTMSSLGNLSINKNTATEALAFFIGDVETVATSLTVTRNSSNLTLVPLVNVVLGGSGGNRLVTISPATNQTGTSTITLNVSDGTTSLTRTFLLTVIDGLTLSSWRQTHFPSTANSGDGADLNDFDKDGRVNLMEYALGSLPKNPTITNVPVTATEVFSTVPYLTMTITKPTGITGITYLVEVSGTINTWSSGAGNTTVVIDNATTLKVRDSTPANGGKRFIRLKVTNP